MSFQDYMTIGAMIFAFAILGLVFNFMYGEVSSQMINVSVVNASPDAVTAIQAGNTTANRIDYVIFIIFIALILALIITGYFSGLHPIFMFVYIIVIVCTVIFASIISNVWDSIAGQSTFVTTITNFPITNHLLSNLPIYAVVTGFIGFISSFFKLSQR